jgi:protein-tyrosine-phosphatase
MVCAIFNRMVNDREDDADEWRIDSAGTWAIDGLPAAEKSQLVLGERGYDLSDHHSKVVDSNLLRSFNLILTMENGHKEAIIAEFPEVKERVYLLNEMVGKSEDIRDPIGGSYSDFYDTVSELESILTDGYDRIVELARGAPSN